MVCHLVNLLSNHGPKGSRLETDIECPDSYIAGEPELRILFHLRGLFHYYCILTLIQVCWVP